MPLNHLASLAGVVLLSVAAGACESDDLGQPCGTETVEIEGSPVVDEDPVIEVVNIERDGVCRSFQCLRHMGVDPYCTRECGFVDTDDNQECSTDDDCNNPTYCYEGTCRDDDCPTGFWCRHVQDVGPYADTRFCVRRTGCQGNFDCEAIGEVDCRQYGCFDACCLEGEEETCECESRRLTCQPAGQMEYCQCLAEGVSLAECEADQIVCQSEGLPEWPDDKLPEFRGICERSN